MTDSHGTTDTSLDQVPDADRAEQDQPAVAPDFDNPSIFIGAEVPEADAIEQALPGPLPDEDEAR
ncbi:MAG TPA: hypothetical protein VFJ85_09365 [Acidimicrobiales bacterium]|nr:hypothetical protein [Acidimicrobiales bacterium]